MILSTLDYLPQGPVRTGSPVFACAITAANVFKDWREHLTNTLGGRMRHYEALMEQTLQQALERLEAKAAAAGYDGVLGVRIAHPSVVDGGVEIVVYGTGFHFTTTQPAPDPGS
ncbi:MAG: YbjQ family protein [Candidatus Competibacterales bacterium]